MDTISAKEVDRYVQDDRYMIIDLRAPEEYRAGHIRNAVNVPYGEFVNELRGKTGKILVLYCERGGLSMTVARELERKGWKTKSVVGGFRSYRGENLVRFRG